MLPGRMVLMERIVLGDQANPMPVVEAVAEEVGLEAMELLGGQVQLTKLMQEMRVALEAMKEAAAEEAEAVRDVAILPELHLVVRQVRHVLLKMFMWLKITCSLK